MVVEVHACGVIVTPLFNSKNILVGFLSPISTSADMYCNSVHLYINMCLWKIYLNVWKEWLHLFKEAVFVTSWWSMECARQLKNLKFILAQHGLKGIISTLIISLFHFLNGKGTLQNSKEKERMYPSSVWTMDFDSSVLKCWRNKGSTKGNLLSLIF